MFPMMLIMVLLRLGHRVQKLLRFLLVLKTKHTLCTCIYQGICTLICNPYLHLKVCHSSNCFQDILQTNKTPDGALIRYQTAHCWCFKCKGVAGRRQQNRLNIDNLQATVVPQKLHQRRHLEEDWGATEPKQHWKSKPASPHG